MIRANKKVFIFRQGNCTMNVLHPSLSKSFALCICNRDRMKNSTLGFFLQEYIQPNASQVAIMMALWKIVTVFRSSSWNCSSPHYVTYFIRQRLQKFTEKVTSKIPFREKSWENIHFCVFKKETFISNGRKIYVNSSKKYVKFFSSEYYFPSYISLLILWLVLPGILVGYFLQTIYKSPQYLALYQLSTAVPLIGRIFTLHSRLSKRSTLFVLRKRKSLFH